jgi:streptogramin lyase
LVQRGLSLSGGTQYTIDFFAKGSGARPMTVGVNQSNSPWSKLFARTVTLSTDWHEYSMTFTIPASQANAMMSFNFAQSVGQVWVDDVSLNAQ